MIAKDTLNIPKAVVDAATKFEKTEILVKETIFPMLEKQEISDWQVEHTRLLNLVIDGGEISRRMSLYNELGLITRQMALQICHRVESFLEALVVIRDRLDDDAHESLLKSLSKDTIDLLYCLRKLKPLDKTQ